MISVVMRPNPASVSRSWNACATLHAMACCSFAERVDARPVLRADIIALPVALRRIVVLPEQPQQRAIRDARGIEHDEDDLVMPRPPGANLVVSRVRRQSTRVSDARHDDAVAKLPELALDAPEAPHAEHRRFAAGRIGPLQRPAIHEVRARGGQGLRAAGQRCRRRRHFGFLVREEHGLVLVRMHPPRVARRPLTTSILSPGAGSFAPP